MRRHHFLLAPYLAWYLNFLRASKDIHQPCCGIKPSKTPSNIANVKYKSLAQPP